MKNKNFKSSPNTGTIWLFGDHAVHAAWQNPERVCVRLLAIKSAFEDNADAFKKSSDRPAPEFVEREKIDRLFPPGTVHQGLALEVRPLPELDLDDLLQNISAQPRSITLVLDQVNDPHNVGAILRSAAAFGASAIIMQDRHAPPESGVLAKTASGALEIVPIVRVTNISRALDAMKKQFIWVAGFSEHAAESTHNFAWPTHAAICVGNEGDGLRRLVSEQCDFMLRLPTSPAFPGLNVSNAAAIALYACATYQEKLA